MFAYLFMWFCLKRPMVLLKTHKNPCRGWSAGDRVFKVGGRAVSCLFCNYLLFWCRLAKSFIVMRLNRSSAQMHFITFVAGMTLQNLAW